MLATGSTCPCNMLSNMHYHLGRPSMASFATVERRVVQIVKGLCYANAVAYISYELRESRERWNFGQLHRSFVGRGTSIPVFCLQPHRSPVQRESFQRSGDKDTHYTHSNVPLRRVGRRSECLVNE